MEILQILFQVVQGLSALVLIFLVLIHSPKGDGIGAIGSTAQLFSSQKGAEAALNKMTAYVAGTFMVVSLLLDKFF